MRSYIRVVTRYMGSGIKGLHRGGIRYHSLGIWDHNWWDQDQQRFHGIRDQAVLNNNKNHKIRYSGFTGVFKALLLF